MCDKATGPQRITNPKVILLKENKGKQVDGKIIYRVSSVVIPPMHIFYSTFHGTG
jgi:hypothetical protein